MLKSVTSKSKKIMCIQHRDIKMEKSCALSQRVRADWDVNAPAGKIVHNNFDICMIILQLMSSSSTLYRYKKLTLLPMW